VREERGADLGNDGGSNFTQIISAPVRKDGVQLVGCLGRPANSHLRHQCQVLDEANLMALGGLRRADDTPLAVVELSGFRVLALSARRTVHSPQVAQGGSKRQSVERLQQQTNCGTLPSPQAGQGAEMITAMIRASPTSSGCCR
jgi:hypothetical protein